MVRVCFLVGAFLWAGAAWAQQSTAGLLQVSDFNYLGSFRLPGGAPAKQTQQWGGRFMYGGTALAYNPKRKSLFVVGNILEQKVAEISIPTLVKSTSLNDLPAANVLQPFADITGGLRKQFETSERATSSGGARIGGMLVNGNRLLWTVFIYYDAGGKAQLSHGYSSLSLNQSDAHGIYSLRGVPAGVVAGYMTAVPKSWQDKLGSPFLTGQSGIPILSRTSSGPVAVGFDPANLGPTPAQASIFLYYPIKKPVANPEGTGGVWNRAARFGGMAFVSSGSKSAVMYFGRRGLGEFWYGPPNEGSHVDKYNRDKGTHAPPYASTIWFYNPNDFLTVKAGRKQPWDLQPYLVANLPNAFQEGEQLLGGVAYDPATSRLYVAQRLTHKDGGPAVIHVYRIGSAGPAS